MASTPPWGFLPNRKYARKYKPIPKGKKNNIAKTQATLPVPDIGYFRRHTTNARRATNGTTTIITTIPSNK